MSNTSFDEDRTRQMMKAPVMNHPSRRRYGVMYTLAIRRVLTEFEREGFDHRLVREYWADALLRVLLKANPYRDTLAIRQDATFLYFLQDRIERIRARLTGAQ